MSRYRIKAKLGEGAMGTVWLATDGRKRVAIKLLQSYLSSQRAYMQRFFNEAMAAADVAHPGIVRMYEFGFLASGSAFLVMELLEGETLGKRLAASRLTIVELLDVLTQIAHALAAAHAKGIVHRDLKPENVFLTCDPVPQVKLLDFGIAKIKGIGLTRTGVVMGTPHYMSPEQCRGEKAIDGRSDLYSWGVIAYEVTCGRRPFDGDCVEALLYAHQSHLPPPLRAIDPSVPPALEAVIMRALAKDPRERFGSAQELLAALASLRELPTLLLNGLPPGLASPAGKLNASPPPRPAREKQRGVLAGLATAAIIAAIVLGSALKTEPTSSPSRPPDPLAGSSASNTNGSAATSTSGQTSSVSEPSSTPTTSSGDQPPPIASSQPVATRPGADVDRANAPTSSAGETTTPTMARRVPRESVGNRSPRAEPYRAREAAPQADAAGEAKKANERAAARQREEDDRRKKQEEDDRRKQKEEEDRKRREAADDEWRRNLWLFQQQQKNAQRNNPSTSVIQQYQLRGH